MMMIRLALLSAALVTLAACVPPPVEVGRGLFAETCSGCHGAGGRGDGALADSVGKKVPDLTGLSARYGGTFPRLYVTNVIHGYWRSKDPHSVMPAFGDALQDGDLVGVDFGDGRFTPTPERLAALVDYVERLQE